VVFAGKPLLRNRYCGQYACLETNLYYNRFRYYDPEVGQYITKDPIGLAGGNPTLYGYVHDTNAWVDPFGLRCKKPNTDIATGYHATKPEYVQSIRSNGFRQSTAGRAGGGGIYVNNTKKGAMAEYYHYNPNGPKPEIIAVQYKTGANVLIENTGTHIKGPLPISGDTLSFESIRLPGTINTIVRNGSIKIIN